MKTSQEHRAEAHAAAQEVDRLVRALPVAARSDRHAVLAAVAALKSAIAATPLVDEHEAVDPE